MIDIQGIGDSVQIGVTAGQKTSMTMVVLDNKGIEVSDEIISCTYIRIQM